MLNSLYSLKLVSGIWRDQKVLNGNTLRIEVVFM